MLTQERLKELLEYDQKTGVFSWLVDRGGVAKKGVRAGFKCKSGYRAIKIDHRWYQEHRIIWLYVNGVLPKEQIDHINRVKDDNRLCNLRGVTSAQNSFNQNMHVTNTSGYVGVSWHNPLGKWKANIRINKRNKHLGYFDDPQKAHLAYLAAKNAHHLID